MLKPVCNSSMSEIWLLSQDRFAIIEEIEIMLIKPDLLLIVLCLLECCVVFCVPMKDGIASGTHMHKDEKYAFPHSQGN